MIAPKFTTVACSEGPLLMGVISAVRNEGLLIRVLLWQLVRLELANQSRTSNINSMQDFLEDHVSYYVGCWG